jgi:hypothetical protein
VLSRAPAATATDVFPRQAILRPQDIALIDGAHSWTYDRLAQAGAELAVRLAERLPGPAGR